LAEEEEKVSAKEKAASFAQVNPVIMLSQRCKDKGPSGKKKKKK